MQMKYQNSREYFSTLTSFVQIRRCALFLRNLLVLVILLLDHLHRADLEPAERQNRTGDGSDCIRPHQMFSTFF